LLSLPNEIDVTFSRQLKPSTNARDTQAAASTELLIDDCVVATICTTLAERLHRRK
jgi:hypothetical protein